MSYAHYLLDGEHTYQMLDRQPANFRDLMHRYIRQAQRALYLMVQHMLIRSPTRFPIISYILQKDYSLGHTIVFLVATLVGYNYLTRLCLYNFHI